MAVALEVEWNRLLIEALVVLLTEELVVRPLAMAVRLRF